VKVAVFIHTYLPGFRAGGPTLSVAQILTQSRGWEFILFAANKDLGQIAAYPGLEKGGTRVVEGVRVNYVRNPVRDFRRMNASLRQYRPDFYYLNSLHDFKYSWVPLILMRLRLLPSASILLAPRGECAPAALAVSRWKKRIARRVLPILIPRNTTWHASSERELEEIRAWLPERRRARLDAVVAPDPGPPPAVVLKAPIPLNSLEIVFLSRIHPIKGLTDLIRAMPLVQQPARLSIFGVIEDPLFWNECQRLIFALPPSTVVEYRGEYFPDQAPTILEQSDVMVLPTRSENFGRVIAEALAVGCPVLVPDTTMWTDLIRSGGGVIVTNPSSIASTIDRLAKMPPAARLAMRAEVLATYRGWFESHRSEFSPFPKLAQRSTRS